MIGEILSYLRAILKEIFKSLKKLQDLWVAKTLTSPYILCKILSFQVEPRFNEVTGDRVYLIVKSKIVISKTSI